ncbi:hypothetical protein [Corallococcus sp. 4LFB]|uniref:hypothetical protein n=1 Tax=Corallococcus sp. 4LFB TaxID=3383249 RepID=UPI0039770DF8
MDASGPKEATRWVGRVLPGVLRGLLGTVHKTPCAEGLRQTLAALRGGPEAKTRPAPVPATT